MRSAAYQSRAKERGQTILLVVVSAFALLAMAAIAIDVVTLYVARNEAQRAADAAALAGAKAFVSSGYTSNVSSFSATICSGGSPGSGLADQQAQASLALNPVLGVPPTLTTSCNLGTGGTLSLNPQITATVQRTNLPIFLARVLGVFGSSVPVPSVTATATAEAYNPSKGPAPIQVSGVKPWLVPDCLPSSSPPPNTANCATPYFVDVTNGSIVNSGAFIGTTIYLTLNTGGGPLSVGTLSGSPNYGFYPLSIPISPPTPMCASTTRIGCTNTPGPYYDNIACFNPFVFQCGQQVGPASTPNIPIDSRIWTGSLKPRTDQGTQCLIHTNSSGNYAGACSARLLEQDCFSPQGAGQPVLIQPGTANPDPSLSTATYINRSDSVVTVPLFDGSNLCASNPCSANTTVVGFLQLGIIQDTASGSGQVEAIILNASGCNTGATAPPVSGGGVSPIPVRLIGG